MALIALRESLPTKTKARKKNWLGPTNATIMERIVGELEFYNIPVNMDSTIDRTHKEIARQVYGMNRINRMNIPLIALVLAIRSNEQRYDEYTDNYMRRVMMLKDIPPENVIRDGLQIDIIRYNKVIDDFILSSRGIEYEEGEEEEENYDEAEEEEEENYD